MFPKPAKLTTNAREKTRQMWSTNAETTTNDGKVAHIWSAKPSATLQTREKLRTFGAPRCAALKQSSRQREITLSRLERRAVQRESSSSRSRAQQ